MRRYLAPALFFAFICSVIVMADAGIPNVFMRLVEHIPLGDKLGHFMLFGMLTLLLDGALRGRAVVLAGWTVPLAGLLVLGFAWAEEASQAFFPNRTLDLADALADLAGVAAFSLLARWRARRAGPPPPAATR